MTLRRFVLLSPSLLLFAAACGPLELFDPSFGRGPLQQKDGCVVSGCSSEICADQEHFSTCIYRPEAACYQSATCERQSSGQCGWTQTAELLTCLGEAGSPLDGGEAPDGGLADDGGCAADGGHLEDGGHPEDGGVAPAECVRSGCSGQLCAEEHLFSTCEWLDSYACYQAATCERQPDGRCGFTPDDALAACLAANP